MWVCTVARLGAVPTVRKVWGGVWQRANEWAICKRGEGNGRRNAWHAGGERARRVYAVVSLYIQGAHTHCGCLPAVYCVAYTSSKIDER